MPKGGQTAKHDGVQSDAAGDCPTDVEGEAFAAQLIVEFVVAVALFDERGVEMLQHGNHIVVEFSVDMIEIEDGLFGLVWHDTKL